MVSALFGAGLAVSGWVRKEFPRRVTVAAQATIGVLMGAYIDLDTFRDVGPDLFGLAGALVATIVLCLVTGLLLPRFIPIDLLDSVLGMVPGGTGANVAIAEELQADTRVVAFMQYLRTTVMAASAPLVVVFMGRRESGERPPAAGWPKHFVDNLELVEGDDQLLGLAGLITLCVSGYLIGRLLRLPAAAMIGPMLVSTAVPAVINHQFGPSELVKQFVFVIVGLEIGLKFRRESLPQIWRLLPGVGCAVLAIGVATGIIAALLAAAIGIPFLDAYLATSPGGRTAVMAAAVSANADLPLIASVQALRLFVMVLVTTLIGRWLTKRRKRAASPLETDADNTGRPSS